MDLKLPMVKVCIASSCDSITRIGGYSSIISRNNLPVKVLLGNGNNTTNHRLLLMALIHTFQYLPKPVFLAVSSADRSFKEVMDCADKRVSNLDLWALLDKGLEKHKIGIYLFRNRYVWERYGISKLAIKHAKEQRIKRIKRPLTVVQQVVLDIDSLI